MDREHGTGARDVPESLGSSRVLIVDDDDFAGNLLIALFRDMGQRPERVATLREALESSDSAAFDLQRGVGLIDYMKDK